MGNSAEQHKKSIGCFRPGGSGEKSLRQRRKEFRRSFYHGDINNEGKEAFTNILTSTIFNVFIVFSVFNVFLTANTEQGTINVFEKEKCHDFSYKSFGYFNQDIDGSFADSFRNDCGQKMCNVIETFLGCFFA